MQLVHTLVGLLVSFVVLAALFTLLNWLSPGQKAQRFFRRGFGVDVFYWFFTSLVTKSVSRIAMIVVAVPLILAVGFSWEQLKHGGYHGFGPISRQPIWLQGIEIFLLGDLLGYWMHRLFHGRSLWPFHSVHHCSTEVDWLSSVRLHPLNEVVTRVVEVIPLFATGYNPKALVAYVPLITLYAILLHANVNWSFGPFRYLIASPVFHRWHHSKEPEAIDRNFAGFVALWDVIFGTFYMPKGKIPGNFGVNDPVPESLWGQLAYPFRSRGG